MRFLLHWLLDALLILGIAKLLPGMHLKSFGTALLVAAVLGILGVTLGPILRLIGGIITLPAILLTFGLFYLVVRFLVGTFLLWMTDKLVTGLHIADGQTLLLASLLITVGHHFIAKLLQLD